MVLPPKPRLIPCQVPTPSPEVELKEKALRVPGPFSLPGNPPSRVTRKLVALSLPHPPGRFHQAFSASRRGVTDSQPQITNEALEEFHFLGSEVPMSPTFPMLASQLLAKAQLPRSVSCCRILLGVGSPWAHGPLLCLTALGTGGDGLVHKELAWLA